MGLHIAHVHKNHCGSRDFPNQALPFLNRTPIFSLLPHLVYSFLLPSNNDNRLEQQEKVRHGNEAIAPMQLTRCHNTFTSYCVYS